MTADLSTYMIWFLATALMTITVLTVGALAAAELLPRRKRADRRTSVEPAVEEEPSAPPVTDYVDVGSWFGGSYPAGAVIVGYDGGRHTSAAVRWAAGEAVRRGVPLVVLHAAHYPGMVVPSGPGLWYRAPDALEASEEVTARGVAEALEAHPAVEVVGATEVTSPVRALIEAARGASLVVVGSRRRGALTSALFGSTSREVIGRTAAPVAVVGI